MTNFFSGFSHRNYPGIFAYCLLPEDVPDFWRLTYKLVVNRMLGESNTVDNIKTGCYLTTRVKRLSFYLE